MADIMKLLETLATNTGFLAAAAITILTLAVAIALAYYGD